MSPKYTMRIGTIAMAPRAQVTPFMVSVLVRNEYATAKGVRALKGDISMNTARK